MSEYQADRPLGDHLPSAVEQARILARMSLSLPCRCIAWKPQDVRTVLTPVRIQVWRRKDVCLISQSGALPAIPASSVAKLCKACVAIDTRQRRLSQFSLHGAFGSGNRQNCSLIVAR